MSRAENLPERMMPPQSPSHSGVAECKESRLLHTDAWKRRWVTALESC